MEFLRIRFFNQPPKYSGDDRGRTGNLRLAKPALSQLSYIPPVGVRGFEPRTSALSELRSNQLSYTPSDETLKGFGPKRRMLKIFIVKFKSTQHRNTILRCQAAESATFFVFSLSFRIFKHSIGSVLQTGIAASLRFFLRIPDIFITKWDKTDLRPLEASAFAN